MQSIIKKLLIMSFFIITFEQVQSKVFASNTYNFDDFGIISIMYHRFDEKKYPSTNIEIEIFKKQLEIIEEMKIKFVHPKDFS